MAILLKIPITEEDKINTVKKDEGLNNLRTIYKEWVKEKSQKRIKETTYTLKWCSILLGIPLIFWSIFFGGVMSIFIPFWIMVEALCLIGWFVFRFD